MHAVSGTQDTRLSVTLAYDAIAAGYDEQVRGDQWMRRALHARYSRAFRAGDRVLDVGCGTGIDAVALAHMGVRVLGVDGSAAMIARLREKVAGQQLQDMVEARVLNIQDLGVLADENGDSTLPGDACRDGSSLSSRVVAGGGGPPRARVTAGCFDGLISAFASLSSLPDLAGFAADAARLVRPGGRVVLHLLNRFSLWEWLGYVRRGAWRAARRMGGQRTRQFHIGGQAVQHALYFADEAYRRFFAPSFVLRAACGLGALRPPHTVRRLPPRLVDALEWCDVRVGGWPLVNSAGRFFVLDLERRPPSS